LGPAGAIAAFTLGEAATALGVAIGDAIANSNAAAAISNGVGNAVGDAVGAVNGAISNAMGAISTGDAGAAASSDGGYNNGLP
jgi:hypothetical protein